MPECPYTQLLMEATTARLHGGHGVGRTGEGRKPRCSGGGGGEGRPRVVAGGSVKRHLACGQEHTSRCFASLPLWLPLMWRAHGWGSKPGLLTWITEAVSVDVAMQAYGNIRYALGATGAATAVYVFDMQCYALVVLRLVHAVGCAQGVTGAVPVVHGVKPK